MQWGLRRNANECRTKEDLEKELPDILKITNPLVPATLDPNSPTAMSIPEVESEELDRLRKRRDEIQQMLDEDSSEEDMRARVWFWPLQQTCDTSALFALKTTVS